MGKPQSRGRSAASPCAAGSPRPGRRGRRRRVPVHGSTHNYADGNTHCQPHVATGAGYSPIMFKPPCGRQSKSPGIELPPDPLGRIGALGP